MLRDNTVPELQEELADEPLLLQIHEELKTIREILKAFSAGDFSHTITTRGIIPGCLKAIQANLNHLIWRLQMVEKGNFSQEIRYMGEFSLAFNSMVRNLRNNMIEMKEQEKNLKESEARFKFLASHDPLTGIYNRRSFTELAGVALNKASQLSAPCCLAMMDIDHFKNFNDTHGHLAGDEALRHTVKTIEAALRKNDFMGRYGGEEFIIFFYDTNEEIGMKVLERLRKNLPEKPVFLKDGPVSIYASFGLAGSSMADPNSKDYVKDLINAADTALYTAKKTGRNKVILYNFDQTLNYDPPE